MAIEIQKGDVFSDGQVVTAARLNNLIDLAVILQALISDKASVTPVMTDQVLLYQTASDSLKKANVSAIPGVASVALTSAIPGTTVVNTTPSGPAVAIAINQVAQPAQSFLASPATGTGLPSFRQIAVQDLTLPAVAIAAANIDWSLGHLFYKGLTANSTFTMNFGTQAQTIYVHLYQATGGNWTVTWDPGIRWDGGGTPPVQTTGINHSDIYQFWLINAILYGKRIVTNAI